MYICLIHVTFARLFLRIWNKCTHVLLSSCLRCFSEACGLVFVTLTSFVWLYLAACIWEIQRNLLCFCRGLSVWRPLWIACTEDNAVAVERIRAVILSGDVSDDDSIDDGKECDDNYVEQGKRDSCLCRMRYVGWLSLHTDRRYWQLVSLEMTRRSGVR